MGFFDPLACLREVFACLCELAVRECRRVGKIRQCGLDALQLFLAEVLQGQHRVARILVGPYELVGLSWIETVSRFCVFCIRKTIRNVTMVVPVLMINCQVSE